MKNWKRTLALAAGVWSCFGVQAMAAENAPDKRVGVGVEFAHGPGLSVKVNVASDHALQFGLSAFDYGQYRSYALDHGHYYYGYATGYDGFLVHGEYLNRPGYLLRGAIVNLPWYWGGGGDLGLGSGTVGVAVHANLGLALQFRPVPIDVFLEWTPRLWVIDFVQFHPVDLNAGVRFWF